MWTFNQLENNNERIFPRRATFSDMDFTKFTLAAEWKRNWRREDIAIHYRKGSVGREQGDRLELTRPVMLYAWCGIEEGCGLLEDPIGSKVKTRHYGPKNLMLFNILNNIHIVFWKENVCMKKVVMLTWLLEMSSWIISLSMNVPIIPCFLTE